MPDPDGLEGVRFATPPVIETALSIEFASLRFGYVETARCAALWADEYPLTEEHEALPPSRPVVAARRLDVDWRTGLPPVRLWSLSRDLAWVLQLQHDRLTANWRKTSEASTYPGYEAVLGRYQTAFDALQARANELTLGELHPAVVEYTYVNRVDADLERILAVLLPLPADVPGTPAFTRYQSVQDVVAEGVPGQTTITAEPANGGMSLTISTRMFPEQVAGNQVWSLVKAAHDLSKATFVAFTKDDVQRTHWGRKQ